VNRFQKIIFIQESQLHQEDLVRLCPFNPPHGSAFYNQSIMEILFHFEAENFQQGRVGYFCILKGLSGQIIPAWKGYNWIGLEY
jgi:hypothetical protein